MWVRELCIRGFRGIEESRIPLGKRTVLVGPNGCGKSTVVDALSLVLGRDRMVAPLTEHDFTGCSPTPADRIHIVASIVGFADDDPDNYPSWFRPGGATEYWMSADGEVHAEKIGSSDSLCPRIAFAARFDHEDLEVDRLRYFPDDLELPDPFEDEGIQPVSRLIVGELGFYVLPARRDRDHVLSFASNLFRTAVAKGGGIPADSVLKERDRVRAPAEPLETAQPLAELAARLNERIGRLDPSAPEFQLRLTSTDSEGVLSAMVPHYRAASGASLPAGRHGSGLLSLQSLLLLGEIGRARVAEEQGFILAVEEPELHVPPGSQRRVIQEAARDAVQVVCTTHSPRVAAFFHAHEVCILELTGGRVVARPLVAERLSGSSTNQMRKLFVDLRPGVVEALMFPYVLIPEGRLDYHWLRLLVDVTETNSTVSFSSFGGFVGVVPTTENGPAFVYEHLSRARSNIATLVDGDAAGKTYAKKLRKESPPPAAILMWDDDWAIEDVICWILSADEDGSISGLGEILEDTPDDLADLRALLSAPGRQGGLKEHYLVHEGIAGIIGMLAKCRERAIHVLDALVAGVVSGDHDALKGEEGSTIRRVVLP